MAILTTIAIVTGITVAVGGGITAGIYFATEDDRIKAEIEKEKLTKKNCETAIDAYNDLKNKLEEGKNYLSQARSDFLCGGHVNNGETCANSEFTSCLKHVNDAIDDAFYVIADFTATKEAAEQKIKELQAKLK